MPKRKKKNTEENILNALDYIKSGSSIREASRRYKFPNSTLRWRTRNIPKKPGPAPLLNPDDEKQLVDYIRFQASKGSPVTTTWLLATAARLMKHR